MKDKFGYLKTQLEEIDWRLQWATVTISIQNGQPKTLKVEETDKFNNGN